MIKLISGFQWEVLHLSILLLIHENKNLQTKSHHQSHTARNLRSADGLEETFGIHARGGQNRQERRRGLFGVRRLYRWKKCEAGTEQKNRSNLAFGRRRVAGRSLFGSNLRNEKSR